jgi:hypothetical protein
MIERIILEDFQAHKKLDIQLAPVTTLVGPSDVGKSAVLRALRWVAENRPQGNSFIRDGAASAAVSVRAEGVWTVRRRSERENVYEFNGEVYSCLRATSVPETIAAHLNTGPVNFQSQLDAPYWLADTAGEVSRQLNAVVNLGEIDEILGRAAAAVRAYREREKLIQERLAKAEQTVRDTEWTAAADRELTELEERGRDWTGAKTAAGELRELLAELGRAETELVPLVELVPLGQIATNAGTDAAQAAAQRFALAEILAEIERHGAAIAPDPGDDWDALKQLRADGDAVADELRELRHLLEESANAEREVRKWQRETESAEAELATQTAGRCPLCNQPAAPSQFSPPTSTSPTASPSHAGREPVRRGTRPRPATSDS